MLKETNGIDVYETGSIFAELWSLAVVLVASLLVATFFTVNTVPTKIENMHNDYTYHSQ